MGAKNATSNLCHLHVQFCCCPLRPSAHPLPARFLTAADVLLLETTPGKEALHLFFPQKHINLQELPLPLGFCLWFLGQNEESFTSFGGCGGAMGCCPWLLGSPDHLPVPYWASCSWLPRQSHASNGAQRRLNCNTATEQHKERNAFCSPVT